MITLIQNLWDTAKAVLRGKFIAIQTHLNFLTFYLRKISNKQSNLTLKATRKRRTKKTQS